MWGLRTIIQAGSSKVGLRTIIQAGSSKVGLLKDVVQTGSPQVDCLKRVTQTRSFGVNYPNRSCVLENRPRPKYYKNCRVKASSHRCNQALICLNGQTLECSGDLRRTVVSWTIAAQPSILQTLLYGATCEVFL